MRLTHEQARRLAAVLLVDEEPKQGAVTSGVGFSRRILAIALLAGASACLAVGVWLWRDTSRRVPRLHGAETGLSLSPDGSALVFSRSSEGTRGLFRLSMQDRTVSLLYAAPRAASWPAFSSDGRQVAFAMEEPGGNASGIWLLDLTSKAARQLTNSYAFDTQPAFVTGEQAVVFARARTFRTTSTGGTTWDDWDIFELDISSGAERPLTDSHFRLLTRPAVSPDGGSVAFGGVQATSRPVWTIYLVPRGPVPALPIDFVANTLAARATTSVSFSDPCFAPDGKSLYFTSSLVSRASVFDYEVWRVNLDGTGLSQVTRNRAFNAQPAVTADGQVVYLSDVSRNGTFEVRETNTATGAEQVLYPTGSP